MDTQEQSSAEFLICKPVKKKSTFSTQFLNREDTDFFIPLLPVKILTRHQ